MILAMLDISIISDGDVDDGIAIIISILMPSPMSHIILIEAAFSEISIRAPRKRRAAD